MSFFTVEHLSAGYGGRTILKDVSFSLEKGTIMGILGANGCGKTTLLKAICGILPHEGNCLLQGTPLEGLKPKKLAQKCSYIPQRSGIMLDISALDVVLMGFNPQLGLLERPTDTMVKNAENALKTVGLPEKSTENYQHLSEGQKQLCILARTLVADTELLLLDEPESALDFRFRYEMLNLLQNFLAADKAAILALHDPNLALNHCRKLLLIQDGIVLDILDTKEDSLISMEEKLIKIYGEISLHRMKDSLVMLREGL